MLLSQLYSSPGWFSDACFVQRLGCLHEWAIRSRFWNTAKSSAFVCATSRRLRCEPDGRRFVVSLLVCGLVPFWLYTAISNVELATNACFV